MTNRRTRKKTTRKAGKRGVAIDGDVSGSTIITGDGNVVQISRPANPVATALHQLRAPVGDFVGREQEINTLIDALSHASSACIGGINGMGGTGKTELALLVAQRLSVNYPEAQFFINLQGTAPKPRPPQEVMATCIRAFLGPEARLPEDLDQLTQLYRSQLNGKRVLLLLDNAADSAQVRPLLPPPGCGLLVTSRQTITLPGMTSLTLNALTGNEARKLLLEIAPRAQPAVEEICKFCGYLPLAIRAAGSLLAITADLDPSDFAAQLKDERNRLKRLGTEGVEMDVAASFNLSYVGLTPEAARVFRLLSVFPGTFDAAAAEVVCDDAGHVSLSDSVRRSLVLYDASTKRYRLHDLARLFAGEKLSVEERAAGMKRHATHYKEVLAAANDLYLQGGKALISGLELFDLEWANIQAGHAWVAAQDVEVDEDVARLSMAYPNAGLYVLHLRQHPRERIRWLEITLATARRLKHRTDECTALGNLGIAYSELGEPKRAIEFYEQGLLIYREHGHRKGEGNALGSMGVAHAALNKTKLAIQFFEEQLAIAQETGDRKGEGNALGNLGCAYCSLGESQRAFEFCERALVIDRERGDLRSEGSDLLNMSLALDQLGKHAEALQHAEQALTIFEQIEDPKAATVRAQLAAWRGETISN